MLRRWVLSLSLSLAALGAAVGLAPGCGSETHAGPPATIDTGTTTFVPLDDAGACGVTTRKYALDYAVHVEQGSPLTYNSNPPCGGNHYPIWALFRSHPKPLPRGNWIHNLEHGGIVFTYRCASRAACPEIAAQLEAVAAAMPVDPLCSPPLRNRIVITPDPELPEGVTVAASAWGYTLVARCVDAAAFGTFYKEHVGRASEQLCADGAYYADDDAGVVGDAIMSPPDASKD